MGNHELKVLVNAIDKLNDDEFRLFRKFVSQRDMKKNVAYLLEHKAKVKCGHCESKNFILYGRKNDLQRYKCKDCNRVFNQLTGTPLARLRKKGRWLNFCECMKNGLSVRKTATLVGINKNTSFNWRHKFLENSKDIKPNVFKGVVEMNQTKFKYSEKGKINKNYARHLKEDVYVVINRDRHKSTNEEIVWKLDKDHIKLINQDSFEKDILMCTDNIQVLKNYSRNNKLRYGSVDIKNGKFVNKDVVHIQNSTDYKANLHDWMYRFRGVATKYLKNYLSWYRELDEYNMNIPPKVLLLRAKNLDRYKYLHKN
jgi:transposase-like protein